MVADNNKDARTSSKRSKTLRAFRALRALRPKVAMKLLPHIRTFRTVRSPALFRNAFHLLTSSNGKKRLIMRRLFGAFLSTAASLSLIPVSYALSAVWPEGNAQASPLAMNALGAAPANAVSRWMGKVMGSQRIPYMAHQKLIRMLIKTYGIDTSEVEFPLERYHTLQEFFSRRLVVGARPPHPKCTLVSPCDAELLQVGRVESDEMLVQVKNDSYHISKLLRTQQQFPETRPGYEKVFFLFHLRPRDYHRYHSPADLQIQEAVHTPGTLFPVTYTSSKWIPGLFAHNERVSLIGSWVHGTIAVVPVGATCVGSIRLAFDDRIVTNQMSSRKNFLSLFRFASGQVEEQDQGEVDTTVFPVQEERRFVYEDGNQPTLAKGEELGWFNWGSAIVLIAEVPEGTGVRVRPHQDVRVGDPLLSWSS